MPALGSAQVLVSDPLLGDAASLDEEVSGDFAVLARSQLDNSAARFSLTAMSPARQLCPMVNSSA